MPGRARLLPAAAALFAILAVVYTASIGLRATQGASITGDEPFYLLTTQSLIADGDLDLRQQYDRFSYRSFFDHAEPLWRQSGPLPDGRVLSPHEPGLSMFLVPGFALGGLWGAQVQLLLTAALLFALTFVLVAHETRAPLLAWLATAAVGTTAIAFVYATEVYPELPAAACLVLAVLVLRRPALGHAEVVVLALLVTTLAWLGTKYIPLGAVIAIWTLASAGRRDALRFVALCAVSGFVFAWWHLATFGALTPYTVNTVYDGAPTLEVVRDHVSIIDRAYRLAGLFVDAQFGAGRWAPVLLPALPALLLLRRRGRTGGLVIALVATQVLVATFVAITMRGWWFPGRTLATVLPLLAWPLAELALRGPMWARTALAALAAYSTALTATLWHASANGEVRLAVDPFALSSPLFRAPAALFPDYQAWTPHTVALHLAWCAVALLGFALAARATGWPAPRAASMLRRWRAGRAGAAGVSGGAA